ncbi:MAG TPA: CopG family transcriptional regulator [Terriglobia bacterium]|nr:CopG family transcriptional regulator [Terriglobia bacterium]
MDMEDQLTIRLPRELRKALQEKAAKMRRKPSELVRMAVVEFLQIPASDEAPPVERVRELIGSLQSGIPDLAVHHRKHLLSRIRSGR